MKIVAFTHNGLEQWGVITDEQHILSAADLEEYYFTFLPQTINELIVQGEEGLLTLAAALEAHKEERVAPEINLVDIELAAPLSLQKNIFCIGKNYAEHIKEFEKDDTASAPTAPIVFTKPPTSLIGPEAAIDAHSELTNALDYEGELAVIIGKRGRNISADEADDYIFGYTIVNDVTARDLQQKHAQWFMGKSLDTFCPMGPYILLNNKQEQSFTIETYVNGELRQQGCSDELIFTIPKLIEIISQGITLEPGDVIATGTPKGVGMGFNPPKFLKAGDEVEITITPIGTLRNMVK